mmetsp:Transcript_79414/g.190668  ORF Transcript_79414/g.190668 Transcript_79414/m.190668 type:complete len:221 (+) Transcript_79414:721-1383(+)
MTRRRLSTRRSAATCITDCTQMPRCACTGCALWGHARLAGPPSVGSWRRSWAWCMWTWQTCSRRSRRGPRTLWRCRPSTSATRRPARSSARACSRRIACARAGCSMAFRRLGRKRSSSGRRTCGRRGSSSFKCWMLWRRPASPLVVLTQSPAPLTTRAPTAWPSASAWSPALTTPPRRSRSGFPSSWTTSSRSRSLGSGSLATFRQTASQRMWQQDCWRR